MNYEHIPPGLALEDLMDLVDRNPGAFATLMRHTDDLYTLMAGALMQTEVRGLCGLRRSRDASRYQRWGSNPGTIRHKSERIKVRVQRVRDKETNMERPLETYRALHEKCTADAEGLHEKLLLGLSQRDYKKAVSICMDSIGLSSSTVGRTFIEQSAEVLKEFETRRLDQQKNCALLLDGKCLQGRQIIIAMGVTVTGKKVVLAITESVGENAAAVKSLLEDIIQRGFAFEDRLLVIMDGAKGLRAAVNETFGDLAVVQRCQMHKRENVTGHIKKKRTPIA